jgi:predicted transcriptional regulator
LLKTGSPRVGTLTIRLDQRLDRVLTRLAKRSSRSKGEIALEALQRQLGMETFRGLRRAAMPHAAAAGFLTDEDVFLKVS